MNLESDLILYIMQFEVSASLYQDINEGTHYSKCTT